MQRGLHEQDKVSAQGFLVRLANGPFGRAIIGVALGLVLLWAHGSGWLRRADLSVFDHLSALTHMPWEMSPTVVVAAPSQLAGPQMRSAALANALEAGAAVVGFDETYFQPLGTGQSAKEATLLSLADDQRCVIAEAVPGGFDLPTVQPRLASMEEFRYEADQARGVMRRRHNESRAAVGFVQQVVAKMAARHSLSVGSRRRIERNLELLASGNAVLLDYSMRPAPVQMTTLETIAEAPPEALRERVLGRVVLLAAESWVTVGGFGIGTGRAGSRAAEPAVAWAIASLLAGSGSVEVSRELLGSLLIVASLILMLVMGDRSLGGKIIAGLVAGAAFLAVSLGSLAAWRVFVPPCAPAMAIVTAFLVSVCLELGEAGVLVSQEAHARGMSRTWGEPPSPVDAKDRVEHTLRSVLAWHPLPACALLLRDGARPDGLVRMLSDGTPIWDDNADLESLGRQALLSETPTAGDWPNLQAKALALPVILGAARGAALILATPRLPPPGDVVEFGRRVVRQLLATRTPRSLLGPMVPNAARHPARLSLPLQIARLNALEAARQQQSALAAAWRAGPHEAVVVFDVAGRPVLWNRRAEILFNGDKNVNLAGTHMVPLLARALETDESEVRSAAMGVLLQGVPYICDLEDPNGRYNYVASLTRVDTDGEAPAGLALRCIDVTGVCRPARVEARLMSIAAHEMRTPLTSVIGYAELLMNKAPEGSPIRRYAEAIDRQAHRMEAIVGELLTVTRLEAGREELIIEPVDMRLLAEQVCTAMQPLAHARCIALSVESTGDVEIRGDVPKLERLVENLVNNAIKYSPEGAQVQVRVWREHDCVVLAVQDTGYGIPPEDAPHVFEKFYRAKHQPAESIEGTGLGLAIVRLIAEAHGGSVSLRTALGVGSTFTIRLPVLGPSETRASHPAA